jgi:hypothetical protein
MVFGSTAAFAGEKPVDDGRSTIVGEIIDLFKVKGTFSNEEAATLRDKTEKQAPGKDLEEVVQSLGAKGVLNEDETAEMTHKIRTSYLPGGDIDMALEYLEVLGAITGEEAEQVRTKFRATPLGKEKDYYERIASYVERKIRAEVQGEMKKEIKEESVHEAKSETKKSLPNWLSRISFGGDVRLRFEGDFFDQNNADLLSPSNPTQLLNTKVDRNRFLLRARLNMTARVTDEVEAVIGISTGTTSNPVSQNVTLGDFFNKKSIVLDLGYLKWTPLPTLTLWGGRIPSPWFSTDLVWWPDLRFDGFAANYAAALTPRVGWFVTAGVFPVQEVEFSARDKWLLAGQAGVQYKPAEKVNAKLGVAFYDFENMAGRANTPDAPNANDYTAPQFQQKGNTLFDIDPSANIKTAYAADFRELDVLGALDLAYWEPVHIIFIADYVKNLGFDKADVIQRTGNPDIKEETTGYQVGLAIGHPEASDFGDWKGYFFYKYLEADAVVDAFTDPDFHLGGTNAKGWIIGGEAGLLKNVWLSARWLSADQISGPPLAVDVFQLNLNARF